MFEASYALQICHVGGPTALLHYGSLRLLTDPTFDAPSRYERAPGVYVDKLAGPAVTAAELGPVDAVLLSHDHHMDNLDRAGRELLPAIPRVLTTVAGAGRLGGSAEGMAEWEALDLDGIRITAVPAQHGDADTAEHTGPVLGFVLRAPGRPTVYVSGDNASVEVVQAVAERLGPIDVALLFLGAASLPALYDGVLTLSADRAVAAAEALGDAAIVPLHYDGWGHYTEGLEDVTGAFAAAGLRERLLILEPGALEVVA